MKRTIALYSGGKVIQVWEPKGKPQHEPDGYIYFQDALSDAEYKIKGETVVIKGVPEDENRSTDTP
jgi:hypothetical protein